MASLNLVLMTTGLRSVARAFSAFPERPVGVIDWDVHTGGVMPRWKAVLARLLALLRGRRYANLQELCEQQGLKFAAIDKRDAHALERCLHEWGCNLVITSNCAMVPMAPLETLSHGAINLHPSLLPDYRGPDPLFWQVVDGVPKTGVTVHRLLARPDAGAILQQQMTARPDGLSRGELSRLTERDIGIDLLHEAVRELKCNPAAGRPQPRKSSTAYASSTKPALFSSTLALSKMSPKQVWNVVRFLGSCPPDWLQTSSSGRLIWRPIGYTGQLSTAAPGGWRRRRFGLLKALQHPAGTLWFRASVAVRKQATPVRGAAEGHQPAPRQPPARAVDAPRLAPLGGGRGGGTMDQRPRCCR